MITLEKLKIYEKYMDIDFFARSGTQEEKALLSDSEWMQIEHIIDSLFLIKNKSVSEDFEAKIYAEIDEKIEPETFDKLEKMVKENIFNK